MVLHPPVGPAPDGPPDAGDDLALALNLADLADAAALAHYGNPDLAIRAKPDRSLVSAADTAVETELRSVLARRRPDDAIVGEELGRGAPGASRQWIIDPIDATDNFIRGVPVWATLIALVDGGRAVVGVVSAPALGRRWWAVTGGGAWAREPGRSARRLAVSRVASPELASLSYSDLAGWSAIGRREQALTIIQQVARTRAFGDFWSYMLLAEGAIDLVIDPALALWDVAALIPIVREAGGVITSLDGGDPLGVGAVLASNGLLHQHLVAGMAT